jgi:uncharacterized membrane protein YccC
MRIPGQRHAPPGKRAPAGPRPDGSEPGASGATATADSTAPASGERAGIVSRAYGALRERDPGGGSLRRAARVAIVVPVLAAFTGSVIGIPGAAIFAVFAAFALLGMADFGGPRGPRARAYALATLAGAVLVALGTLASPIVWATVVSTMLVAFVVRFLGVFGGQVVAAQTPVTLAFVVAVSTPAPLGAVWVRLAGWLLGGVAALVAGVLLWPRLARGEVRHRSGEACEGLASLLTEREVTAATRERAREKVAAARRAYDAASLRPGSPARRDQALVDLVVELERVWEFADRIAGSDSPTGIPEERDLSAAIVGVLHASARVLDGGDERLDVAVLDRARTAYRAAADRWAAERLRAGDPATSVVEGLNLGADLRLLAFTVQAVAIDVNAVAGHAVDDLRPPLPLWPAPRAGARPWLERAATTLRIHLHPGTVRFGNSVRAALALGLAILIARVIQVDHGFWVVLGTLSVLRSSALSTGRTALLAVLGTGLGVVVAGALTVAIGGSTVGLWIALPMVVFFAGYAATSLSFVIGQAAFTIFIVMLFGLFQPQGLQLGLVRVEDIALGAGVSLVVAALLWPRGASRELRSTLAALYRADAASLDAAFGYLFGDRTVPEVDLRRRRARHELARAGEAFDVLLTEQGSRTLPTATWAQVTAAGSSVLLAADAMESLGLQGYRVAGCADCADRVRRHARAVVGVLTGFADALDRGRALPDSQPEGSSETHAAVVRCLAAWHGRPDTALGRTALSLTAAWFWGFEMTRLTTELVEPVGAVAATARAPWWC